ncbi:MAG: PP2C family protein-serine/threonine phosphatase [Vicinamibacterales bacterium]
MSIPPPLPRTPGGARRFFDAYVHGLTKQDLERLFTRDTPDAYRFFARQIDLRALERLPWHTRIFAHGRLLFLAFTLKLTPARRAIYGMALVCTFIGLIELWRDFHWLLLPHPVFVEGTLWLLTGFLMVNLLVLLEVADRLSLKNDLEIAREIQQAMLPKAVYQAEGIDAFGMTRPANTVGGDFYDVIPLGGGRVLVALGDVAGKGSPAALLMALLLAMLRTLVDEGLDPAELVTRLNVQVMKQAPSTRFITLFLGVFDPATGQLTYVNAGQNPPLLRRAAGSPASTGSAYEWLREGGVALGMFDRAQYVVGRTTLNPADVLVMYSDGITEAENARGQPFDEQGLQRVIETKSWATARELGWATFEAVERYTDERRLLDDLTVLVVRRLHPLPSAAMAQTHTVGV